MFSCLGHQLQPEGIAEGDDFFNWDGRAHRLELVHERTSLAEFLTLLVWQTNLRSDQCRVKPAQQETTFQFACLTPSHSLSLSGEASLGQQNYATPLVQGSVPSSNSYISSGPCHPTYDPNSLSTSAFSWLEQSKVTQLSQNWSGQMKKTKIYLINTVEAVKHLWTEASYEAMFSWILNAYTGIYENEDFKY